MRAAVASLGEAEAALQRPLRARRQQGEPGDESGERAGNWAAGEATSAIRQGSRGLEHRAIGTTPGRWSSQTLSP